METLRQFAEQLKQLWTRQSVIWRVLFLVAAAICLVVIVGVVIWVKPEYSVLFSDLPVEDAAEITAKLDAEDVPYRLSAEGTTVSVPKDRTQKLRMDVAVSGLPSGPGKGWGLFDDSQFGMTPFQQNVAYQRAIQSELARTIMQLDQVESAWVHVVQPDDTPFVREKKPVTSSVVIKTELGAALSRKETEGIVALVAGSVKGLTPEHVTVLDTQHRVLSRSSDPYEEMSSRQLEYQRDVESYLAEKAQQLLVGVYGEGNSTVRVTADIDFKRVKEDSATYDPDGRVILKEKTRTLKTTQPETGGTTGAAYNLPTSFNRVSLQSMTGEKEEEEIESEYVVSRTNRTSEKMQGIVKRLTVAVMVREDAAIAAGLPHFKIKPEQVADLVKRAVGYDEARKDEIQVIIGRVKEDEPAESEAAADVPEEIGTWQKILDILQAVSLALAVLAAVGIFLLVRWKMRKPPEPEPEPEPVPVPRASLGNLDSVAEALKKWLDVS